MSKISIAAAIGAAALLAACSGEPPAVEVGSAGLGGGKQITITPKDGDLEISKIIANRGTCTAILNWEKKEYSKDFLNDNKESFASVHLALFRGQADTIEPYDDAKDYQKLTVMVDGKPTKFKVYKTSEGSYIFGGKEPFELAELVKFGKENKLFKDAISFKPVKAKFGNTLTIDTDCKALVELELQTNQGDFSFKF